MYETLPRPMAVGAAPGGVFEELRSPLGAEQAVMEADRCLQCGGPEAEAPCVIACPAHVDIPSFITALAGRHVDAAAATVFADNLLSGTCARVCPVEVLCEGACVLEREGRRPVEIGRLHRYAADWGLAAGGRIGSIAPRRAQRVAVLGAGPAGLVCAGELAALGYEVTVYEARAEPGGLARYAIAPYRQLNDPLPAEARLVADLGAEIRFGAAVDSAAALREIEDNADAIFLAVGMGPDTELSYPGDELRGVWTSLPFIEAVKTGKPVDVGAQVAVIGGGNTAVDVARIARRLGAREVSVLYRRGEAEMPAYPHEVAEARDEGVRFEWLTAPVRFVGEERLLAMECQRMRLGRSEADGRARPQPVPGSEFVIFVDMAIKAVGQQPRADLLGWIDGLEVRDGRVEVDPQTAQTGNPRYFAGGDAVNAGATVVEAVRWAKLAARGIDASLEAR